MSVRKARNELKKLKEIVEAPVASKLPEEAWLKVLRQDGLSHEKALELLK
jgi:hypothetical protein